MAPLHAFLPLALVNASIVVTKLSVTIPHSIKPVTIVFNSFFLIDVNTFSLAKPIENLPFKTTAIWPNILALSCYLIVSKFTFVDRAISPFERTFTI
jgi:hypothetical protein